MANAIKVSTPVGKLMWVNVAGQGKLNYNEDGRDYVASVVLSAEKATPLITAIKEVYDEEIHKGKTLKSMGFKPCDEDGAKVEEGDDELFYSFNFKTRTEFKDGKSKNISIYNSKAAKVSLGDARIGNGSQGAISGSIKYYVNGKSDGISLWLNAIQITKFEEYAEDAGFDTQDGDFEGADDSGFEGQPVSEADTADNTEGSPKVKL